MRNSARGRTGRTGKFALALLTLVVGATVGPTAVAAARPNPVAAPAPAASALTAALRADLTRYLDARGAQDHFSALSLRVTYPGARPSVAVSVGTTRYGGGSPVSDNALWQFGSNTKSFTSVVLLQLEAARKLSLHDTLGKWLPRYPAWRDITLKQLLSMTSGIPDYTEQPAFAAAVQAHPAADVTPASQIAYVAELPLGPTTYAYSNTNYLLAQLVIERAAHDSYFAQVTKRILAPLGLHDTCFGPATCPARIASRLPSGYTTLAGLPALHGKPVPPLAMSWAQGAGGLIGSLKDLTTWDRALYGGRLLPAAQQRELRSLISVTTSKPIRTVTADDPVGFGLGIVQKTDPVTGVTWAYEGEGLGYRVLHVYVPHSRLLIALAVNSGVEVDTLPALADDVYRTLSASRQR